MTKRLFLVSCLFSCHALATGNTCVSSGKEVAYKVTGMSCNDCADKITKHFTSNKSQVATAKANFESGCLKVEWKDGKSMNRGEVGKALDSLGYGLAKDH